MNAQEKDKLLTEISKLHHRFELSKTVGPDYFEPGMMEYLDQSEGIFDETTGKVLLRFESRGTRYDGRTEQIEKVSVGDKIRITRDSLNQFNPNNFLLLTEKGQDVGNMPAELCNAIAPLYDAGEFSISSAVVSFVDPISRRSRHAKQAMLFVELQATVPAVSTAALPGVSEKPEEGYAGEDKVFEEGIEDLPGEVETFDEESREQSGEAKAFDEERDPFNEESMKLPEEVEYPADETQVLPEENMHQPVEDWALPEEDKDQPEGGISLLDLSEALLNDRARPAERNEKPAEKNERLPERSESISLLDLSEDLLGERNTFKEEEEKLEAENTESAEANEDLQTEREDIPEENTEFILVGRPASEDNAESVGVIEKLPAENEVIQEERTELSDEFRDFASEHEVISGNEESISEFIESPADAEVIEQESPGESLAEPESAEQESAEQKSAKQESAEQEIAELEEMISKMEEKNSAYQAEWDDLKTAAEEAESRAESLENKMDQIVKDAESAIYAQQKKLKELDAEKAETEHQVVMLTAELNTLSVFKFAQKKEMKTRISALITKLPGLDEKKKEAEAQLDFLGRERDQAVDGLKKNIESAREEARRQKEVLEVKSRIKEKTEAELEQLKRELRNKQILAKINERSKLV